MKRDERISALEERMAKLDAQLQAERAARRAAERKAKDRATMAAGKLLLSHAPGGGDWHRVDWAALAAYLDRYAYKIAECAAEPLPTDEALARLRAWEHSAATEAGDR